MAAKDERVPGTVPGAEVKTDAPRPGLDGSPPLMAEGANVRADSPAAMMRELKRYIDETVGKAKPVDVEAEIKAAQKREQERRDEANRQFAERVKELATYRAKGEPGKAAGEINMEVGKGRRLVFGGEVFKSADPPGSWMEPVDELAKRRVKEEEERRDRIRIAAEETSLAKASLKQAGEVMDRVSRQRELRAADARTDRVGAGG